MIETLKCPNCGAPLESTTINGNVAVCPYCSYKLMLSGTVTTEQKPQIDQEEASYAVKPKKTARYFKPNMTSDDFENICQKLFDEDPLLPNDIFHEVNFQDIKSVFLPTLIMQGSCSGTISWTDTDGKGYSKQVNRTFIYRTLSNRSNIVPIDIADKMVTIDFGTSYPLEEMDEERFFNEYSPSTQFAADTTNADLSFLKSKIISKINEQLVKDNTKDSYKNIQHNIKYIFDDAESTEYIPCFIIAFKYKTEIYHILCDAVDGSMLIHHLPEDKLRKDLLSSTLSTPATFALIAIVVIPPLLWLFGPLKFGTLLWLAIPAIIVILIIVYYDTKKLEAEKKKVVEEALKARKQ